MVKSLNRIDTRKFSRGERVKVLEPDELKKVVIELAQETLKNYS